MNKGFHGRSLGGLSVTSSNLSCKLNSQPLIPGVFFCNTTNKSDLDIILNHQSSPEETSCIILEPVMVEGGIRDVLITSEVVGEDKQKRLAYLAKRANIKGIGIEIYTDGRRWDKSNVLINALKNASLRRLWRDGVNPKNLYKRYYLDD